jgi:type IV pilus assembly protein PilC
VATFSYKAKDPKGELIQGSMEAENQLAVVGRLQVMGYFPLSIVNETEVRRKSEPLSKALLRRVRISDLTTFNRQLADLIDAGVPLVKALTIIMNQTANPTLRDIVSEVTNDVQGGDTLAQALAKHPKVFSKLFCAMVKAGETGGMLHSVLQRLADFAEAEEELRGKIKSALAYPVVMVMAGIGAITVLMTVVIPKIVVIFAELNQTLPLPTQILIRISNFIGGHLLYILVGAGIVGFIGWNFARTDEGKSFLHGLQIKFPMLGQLIIKRQIARFARTFGSLLHNGVPILTALDITQDVMTNRILSRAVGHISENVTQGSSVASTLRDNSVFPPVVVNMIAIGEETGKLDEVLIKIARSFETEVDRSVKTLTSMIEPMIILLMGGVVGFVVISMLLPIFYLDPGM